MFGFWQNFHCFAPSPEEAAGPGGEIRTVCHWLGGKKLEQFSLFFLSLSTHTVKSDDEEDDWDFERDRNAVKVEFIHGEVDDIIKLQGPTLEILLKVANDMQMNGMLLTDKKIEFTKYEPWNVILTYKVIGQSPPFSLN